MSDRPTDQRTLGFKGKLHFQKPSTLIMNRLYNCNIMFQIPNSILVADGVRALTYLSVLVLYYVCKVGNTSYLIVRLPFSSMTVS